MKYIPHKALATLALAMFLVGCNQDEPEKQELLSVVNDDVKKAWNDSITISVLENDDVPEQSKLTIKEPPENGVVEVNDSEIIYRPQNFSKNDTFLYEVETPKGRKMTGEVTIDLHNVVENVSFVEPSLKIDRQEYQVVFNTRIPLENLRVELSRLTSGETDSAFGTKTIDVAFSNDAYSFFYQPKDSRSQPYGEVVAHELNISVDELTKSDDNSLTYEVVNTPPAQTVPGSFRTTWFNESGARAIIDQRRFSLSWTSFPSWSIPDEPTWRENPFGNKTWLLYYHSLAWLYAYEFQYEQTGDEVFLDEIKLIINDYIKNVGVSNSIHMVWNDHTTAARGSNIAYFYHRFFRNRLEQDTKEQWLAYISEHLDRLYGYFDDRRFYGHNHGLIHANTLYKLSFMLPEIDKVVDYRIAAKTRMNELFAEMVNVDTGASREQSMHYQLVALEMLSGTKKLMEALEGESDKEVADNLKKMVDFTAHLIYLNGGGPSFGDSNYDATNYLSRLLNRVEDVGIETPYVKYLASGGKEGKKLERQYVSSGDGYATTRFIHQEDGEIYDASYMFSSFGKKFFSHGHHDATNVVFAVDGESILVDSGGPYLYTSAGRKYFRSKYAHNILVINNEQGFSTDAELLGNQCVEHLCIVYGRIADKGVSQFRIHALLQTATDPILYVFDATSSSSDEQDLSTDLELLYHFPPQAKLELKEPGKCNRIELSPNFSWCLSVFSSHEKTVEVQKGLATETHEQGWVQPKFGTKNPAPVFSFKSHGNSQYFQLTTLSPEASNISSGKVTELENGYSLEVEGFVIDVSDLWSESPQVTINPR